MLRIARGLFRSFRQPEVKDLHHALSVLFEYRNSLPERNVLRDLYKVIQVAGLGRRSMHDLRHSCVTLLGAQGVPLRTIADIVGHSDIRLTQNVYQHAFMSMKRDAVNALDVFLKTPGVATPAVRKKAN